MSDARSSDKCHVCGAGPGDVHSINCSVAPLSYAPVRRDFRLLTNGSDAELDAIGICIEAMNLLSDLQKSSVVTYLRQRFGVLHE